MRVAYVRVSTVEQNESRQRRKGQEQGKSFFHAPILWPGIGENALSFFVRGPHRLIWVIA